jgi:predicted DNA-binding mobile mystery protein A
MGARTAKLDRKQLDRRLGQVRDVASLLQPPRGGWLRVLRSALGMSQRELGSRLRITPQAAAALEKREDDGTVTLATLRAAAHAIGCEVHYVLVPAQPIEKTLEDRATVVARFMSGQVHHSMRMEDQATSDDERNDRYEEIREQLLDNPSLLWTVPDDL